MNAIPPARPLRLMSVSIEEAAPGTAAGTHVHELAAALGRQGVRVEVVVPQGDPAARGAATRLPRIAATLRRAAALLPAQEVLHLRAHPLLWPLARQARARGVAVVQEVNGRDEDIFVTHRWARPIAGLLKALQRAQYRQADAIAAVTPGLAGWARALPGVAGRVGVIGNGVDTRLFAPGALRPAEAPERRYVVFFGGFHRWHGIATILDAVRHPAWPADLAMLFVGDGPEAALVDAAASEPTLAGRVRRLGRRDHATLAALVSHALASLIVTENRAGLAETGLAPLKLFESMACGVPVVVTDQPGMAGLVRRAGCGLVVPERAPAALAAAIAALAGDPLRAAALGRAARAEAVASHGWDVRAVELLQLVGPLLPVAHGR